MFKAVTNEINNWQEIRSRVGDLNRKLAPLFFTFFAGFNGFLFLLLIFAFFNKNANESDNFFNFFTFIIFIEASIHATALFFILTNLLVLLVPPKKTNFTFSYLFSILITMFLFWFFTHVFIDNFLFAGLLFLICIVAILLVYILYHFIKRTDFGKVYEKLYLMRAFKIKMILFAFFIIFQDIAWLIDIKVLYIPVLISFLLGMILPFWVDNFYFIKTALKTRKLRSVNE